MRRERDDDIYEFMSGDTIKRAEEMVASFSSSMALERRGQTAIYDGALSDLSAGDSRFVKVRVADSGRHDDQLTLISERPLPASGNALLVFRVGPGDDLKYLGRHGDTRPGSRQDDAQKEKHLATFSIVRDVRKR